ncbi:hypothetical protein [Allorhizocola rhizosphaerae]|uniref:hypothetical protein n=1 Tax=Allorhizocola rhizosphaerae TaxID=1872709 RepID=UPI000E3C0325|nr:hypothetical protein [Allorhizocola rhizosphaerae]
MGEAMREALAEAQKWVGTVPGVVMVGQGRDTVDVWVTMPVELPETILGVPVRVHETPPIEAQ